MKAGVFVGELSLSPRSVSEVGDTSDARDGVSDRCREARQQRLELRLGDDPREVGGVLDDRASGEVEAALGVREGVDEGSDLVELSELPTETVVTYKPILNELFFADGVSERDVVVLVGVLIAVGRLRRRCGLLPWRPRCRTRPLGRR